MYSFRELVFGILCFCIIVKRCESTDFSVRSPLNVNAKSCILPQYPKFGKWSIYEETRTARPNEVANHRTILQVTCQDKFKLQGYTTIVCTDGKWTSPVGECLQTCPSRYSTINETITHKNNEKKLENCENLTDLTKVWFQCADFYEDRVLEWNFHVCLNEQWNHSLPKFTPISGQRSLQDPTLIVRNRNATKGDYSWLIGLYNATTKEQLCGESLQNQTVIFTAAHSITDENDHKLSKNLYLVAVDWILPQFSSTLFPKKIKHGYVAGWGQVPIIEEQGLKKHPTFLTNDKLCLGFIGGVRSLCKGDSGRGLVLAPNDAYYVIGVVKKTTVTKFVSHIKLKLRNNRRGSCVLPPHPLSGKWTIATQEAQELQPGMSVSPGTILQITCDNNHKIDGNNVVFCENGKWSSDIATCLKLCPPRISTKTMRVTCIYKHEETENCTDAVNGTFATFTCAPFYEHSSLKKNTTQTCQNGEWDDQTEPKCEPVCGQKTVEATPLIINGTNVTKGDYPWQVALYQKSNKALICGGSLLSQKVVLTAAHCVSDYTGKKISKENYVVAVGKYFRQYNDIRDHEDAQFSELQHIFVAEEYQGANQNYFGDIALLITVEVFVLSRRVQPVCLDVGSSYNSATNEIGYVTGWGTTAENAKQSEVLQELKVPAVSLAACRSNLPEDDHVYLTHDKLCAGYLDKGTSVCKGDSGGGLVFHHDERYWITGIVSISPISPTTLESCDSQQYALYTKVSNYIKFFILPKLQEFKP